MNYLKEAVVFLETNEEVKVVYCNGEYFQDQKGPIQLPDYDPKVMLQQNYLLYRNVQKVGLVEMWRIRRKL